MRRRIKEQREDNIITSMTESPPQTKRDEQYPLLKVDSGGGDVGNRPQASISVTPAWTITCKPSPSWTVRWPEAISTCWMTFTLLGLSFLVFYAMGIGVFRRNHVLLYKYNSSSPASDVYLHHIQQGYYVPFKLYSEYISNIATNYPALRFHVYFLRDDSLQPNSRSRRRRLINKLLPYHPRLIYNARSDISEKEDTDYYNFSDTIKDFQMRHQNVKVTVMNLSSYMDMTPLKYYWKNIPLSYLPFYARVFSVWQNSGVGLDLSTFNNRFNYNHATDHKLGAILKQHNDGINPEEYINALNKIHGDDENEVLGMLFGLVNFIMNETRFLINNTFMEKNMVIDKSLIRGKRNLELELNNDTQINFNNTLKTTNILNATAYNLTANISETPQVALFYDISIFSDGLGLSQLSSNSYQPNFAPLLRNSDFKRYKRSKEVSHLLTIDPEGAFISSSTRMHPFLRHLLFSACQGLPPRFAIQDAMLIQCPHTFRDDLYCNNIFFL
ncbi:hypothetical protein K1T71_007244 [Dendrolimus kikuchii]|uniref:Uncharacterized protein n=1 Tax=Dendrolimus kikuchii TaxID=765133 RepID=A0ACC1D092_9NEOP|nr:hypothetical protein K1T71_007244 [Dendrolimus kikuchii]